MLEILPTVAAQMLDDLPNKTYEEKMKDAMNAMATLHEVNRYNAEVYMKGHDKAQPASPPGSGRAL